MHGPPIVSIAVGKTCGVAPQAAVFYYAMFMTSMPDNLIYCGIIDKIIKRNESASASEKIRIVSISTGTFEWQANFELWKETLEKAEQNGILVVTCADDWLEYGVLERIPGTDPDNPNNYKSGNDELGGLLVPAGNRATASHYGLEVYTYWTGGGMSWAAPYLAGLAALAYQVDPDIKPDEIVKLWIETAVKTGAGPVVNPSGFIDAVQKIHAK
jgi:serine protease AprX